MAKFPFDPAAVAIMSDKDGQTVMIFFDIYSHPSEYVMREKIEGFVRDLLHENNIVNSEKYEVYDNE